MSRRPPGAKIAAGPGGPLAPAGGRRRAEVLDVMVAGARDQTRPARAGRPGRDGRISPEPLPRAARPPGATTALGTAARIAASGAMHPLEPRPNAMEASASSLVARALPSPPFPTT